MKDIEDLIEGNKKRGVVVYDVIVIGSGVVGACVARELGKYAHKLEVLVLEKEGDVSQGSSKANSGIVHGGYDSVNGSLKSKVELEGNAMYEELCNELSVPFKRIGSLVLAFTPADEVELERLLQNGQRNGVQGLEIWTRAQVLQCEPHVSVGVRKALHCPGAGITNPFLFTIANCENAFDNGVKFRFRAKVVGITSLGANQHEVLLQSGEVLLCKSVVNCAGVYSDTLASKGGFTIMPRKGEYLLLAKDQGHLATRVLFQAPTIRYGKGVLVSPTVDGNLLLGPSAHDMESREDKVTEIGELAYVAWAARKTLPHVDTRRAIRSFAGIRSKSSTGDFVLREEDEAAGNITCGGIDSPGLTSAPALAKRVINMLLARNKEWEINSKYIGTRAPYEHETLLALQQGDKLQFELDNNAELNVICRCEDVTESTIRSSIHRLHAMDPNAKYMSTDSIKLRTRAGMGPCQGARCAHLVADLIKQECGDHMQVCKLVTEDAPPTRVTRQEMGRL